MIDATPDIAETLGDEGYNVSSGTFGAPYKVQMDSGYQPVVMNSRLPIYTEQEIVIVDLVPGEPESGPPGKKMLPMEELDWWVKCSCGDIDPRPRAMANVQNEFERILHNGGAFIVFSDFRDRRELVRARNYGRYSGLDIKEYLRYDNWSFLPIFSNLSISGDHGEEVRVEKGQWSLLKPLAEHLNDAEFRCIFQVDSYFEKRWMVLARNKYGDAVAGVILPREKSKDGWIFLLPRIKNKARFLSDFLKDILPDICPGLFPHLEGQKWVHRPEYELPSVLEKARLISDIQDDAARKLSVLEKSIEDDRSANEFLYALIRETGDPLVEAVKKALALLGFESVVDVDDEMTKAGKNACLREDLRIHDKSPVLVVDIKGVAGRPADAEALQAQKHAFIYIQEHKRADVRGLTIINHQRTLPPLERDNEMPFRKEILDNAEQVKLGLMTAWDLFRLVRGFIQNRWRPEQVTPLFYQTGRILPIPQHYEYVGCVKQVWKAAFSVEIEQGQICVGGSIAIEFLVDFHEQLITSLQLNNGPVEVAQAKCEVGIQRNESMPKVKSGMPVYRIKP